MKNRLGMTAMVFGVSLAMSGAVYAAPVYAAGTGTTIAGHAMPGKEKMVSFNLHNASTADIKVKAGETEMTLAAGKTVAMKLPAGVQVVAEEASAHYAAGAVLAVVSSSLNDATITLN